jgi:hypothetical protein
MLYWNKVFICYSIFILPSSFIELQLNNEHEWYNSLRKVMDYSVMTLPRSTELACNVIQRIDEIMSKKGVVWKGFVLRDFTKGEV